MDSIDVSEVVYLWKGGHLVESSMLMKDERRYHGERVTVNKFVPSNGSYAISVFSPDLLEKDDFEFLIRAYLDDGISFGVLANTPELVEVLQWLIPLAEAVKRNMPKDESEQDESASVLAGLKSKIDEAVRMAIDQTITDETRK